MHLATRLTSVLMILGLSIAPANAQYVAGNIGSMPSSVQQRFADSLASIGMTRCAPRALQIFSFLAENSEAQFTVQPLGPDANTWPTVITMESSHADNGRTRLSVINMSTNCSGSYQQTIFWPQDCATMKDTVFAVFRDPHVLLRAVTIAELDAATQVYLIPAGYNGCISVKKELFR